MAAFVLLAISAPVLSTIRNSDIGRLADSEGWATGVITALLLGSWGWVVLILSKMVEKYQASQPLIGLAIVHFVLAVLVMCDAILRGNSTSGVALLLFPIFMTPVIIICTAGIMFAGQNPVQSAE